MLFSTRAEYGVRLMVELGRQEDGAPVALSAVAESERLPLSYLEHLVAKLRKAGLVESQRGAHGGYRLGRPARRDRDARGGAGARGRDRADGVLPAPTPRAGSRARTRRDGDRACATKLLWTRVQGGVTKALAGTTLAELVEFSDQHAPAPAPKAAAVTAA